MSPFELRDLYLFGIDLRARDGSRLSDDTISDYIRFAQDEISRYLEIKFEKTIINEDFNLIRTDFDSWGILMTTYPVRKAFKLDGYFNEVLQITYNNTWLSSRHSSEGEYHRKINIVPPTKGYAPILHHAITPYIGMHRMDHFPNYWKLAYSTGFDSIPMELIQLIGKLATINVLNTIGDLVLGAGIASQSIGIDGLSQSISSTKGGNNSAYGARIQTYGMEIKESLPRMASKYRGIGLTIM